MPAYRFEALDAAGKASSGILEADNNWGERALKPVVMACS